MLDYLGNYELKLILIFYTFWVLMVFSSSYNKSSKLMFYTGAFLRLSIPCYFFKKRKKSLVALSDSNHQTIEKRISYYLKQDTRFITPDNAKLIGDFKKEKPSAYYYDLKQYLYYFPGDLKFNHRFGDETYLEDYPYIVKARPIDGDNKHAILMNLDKHRHFQFVDDPYSYRQKKDMLVWRGAAYQEHRREFMQAFHNHPRCEIGQTNKPAEDVAWQKEKLTIDEQLQYKFILSIEGNDVATSLKWSMSSNSLCFMVKPKFETWFMEGKLVSGVHYVELKEDYSDLDEKMDYYLAHPEQAEMIIKNAHKFIAQFQDPKVEDTISILLLQRYFELSGQL